MNKKQCDFCNEHAYADAQTVPYGPWAYYCRRHFFDRANVGPFTLLKEIKPSAPPIDKVTNGILSEGNCLSSVVTIECEHCGEERRMEPDSDHYNCSGCGYTVKYDVMELTVEGDDFGY